MFHPSMREPTQSPRRVGVLAAAGLLCALPLALAANGTALASNTASLTVGPTSVPGVTVQVCVNAICVATPVVTSVTLTVTATADTPADQVTLNRSTCPDGRAGDAVDVETSITDTVVITGTVDATTANGQTITVPISQTVTVNPGPHGATVSACAS
ncbi:hypothetical protein [Nocardia arthritidis]|uniref:Uncharacterized protein n=1 Tax=Nocardia arthritidis TaxID=228602 RepID=A0A6G9YR30_9NOCA|nr:hypothetical protein [Nocardia arthritidis]QIS15631.1 hypothetical protein F5544_39050 [Nocardia arthritidis]